MSSKKILKTLLIILIFLILIVISTYIIYEKLNYTLPEIEELLNSQKTSSNFQITIEGTYENEPTYTEIFMKDKFYYVTYRSTASSEISQESFYNPETMDLVNVDLTLEGILSTPEASEDNLYFLTVDEDFSNSKIDATEYKYLGTEKINEKKCLKIQFSREGDETRKDYYYINLEDNHIIKQESYIQNYSGQFEKTTDLTYTYSYDTLTDSDVKKFDIDDYPDFLLLE